MKRLVVPLWALLGAVVVLWLLARYDASVTRQDAAFVEVAKRALDAGNAFRARSARLQHLAQTAQIRAQDALRRANGLSTSLDSLRAALPDSGGVPVATVDNLLQLAQTRDSLRLDAIGNLTRAVEAERLRANAAEARVDALEKVVAQGLKVVDCHLLGIGFLPRCPSRTASFGIGAGAGALAVLVAR